MIDWWAVSFDFPTDGDHAMPDDSRTAAPRGRLRWAGVAAVLAAVLAAAAVGYGVWPLPAPALPAAADPASDDDLVVSAATNPGYVGSQACAPCHAARFDTFQRTRHHLASTVPTEWPMPAAFDAGASFPSSEPSVQFTMAREGGGYVQKSIQTTPEGRREVTAPIGLAYGQGGHFDEVYFAWRGDRLSELPVTWLHPTREWANAPVSPHQGGDFSRVTTTRCVECHTTWVGHVPGTPNEYRRETAVLGVGCERCHGPGAAHAEAHRLDPAAAVRAIVQPAALSRAQRIDLCAQCHSNAAAPADLPFTYRPGEPLDKSYKTLVSRHPEEDHVANQTRGMKASRCFERSDMTCLTCHDPHQPTDPKRVAAACAKCHQPADCRERPRLPEAVRGDCVGCHMPARVWPNVAFHTAADRYVPPIRRFQHRVAAYPEATQEVLLAWQKGRPGGAGAAEAERRTVDLVKHWLAEADAYRGAHRFQAEMMALREALHFDASTAVQARLRDAIGRQSSVDALLSNGLHLMEGQRYPDALAAFAKVLAIKPDSAKAHARLGTLNGVLGNEALAREHLRTAAMYDPNDPYPTNMLGWMAYVAGRPADAVLEYLAALAIEPANDAVLYRLGLAYLSLDRLREGRQTFERLYHLNPNHAGGCQGLSHVLRGQREYGEAVRYARRAALLTNSLNADILLSLCDAYSDAGRRPDAIAAAESALQVADDPGLAARLRQRLGQLQGAYSKFGR